MITTDDVVNAAIDNKIVIMCLFNTQVGDVWQISYLFNGKMGMCDLICHKFPTYEDMLTIIEWSENGHPL